MDVASQNPTSRFSDRVENYVKYRPTYPPEVIACLKENCGLTDESIVADVGSGTGLLTKLFLENGNRVIAIEPNREMREAAEKLLAGEENLTSVAGTAEDTGLPTGSVDFIVAGQAFHWFDRAKSKAEFQRILRPGGWVALIWNERETGSSPFLIGYEALLQKQSTDYQRVNHTNLGEDVFREFYAPGIYQVSTFLNSQHFDFEGITGRCLSSSYVPNAGQPGHEAMIAGLKTLFETYQTGGFVSLEYQTRVYHGQFEGPALQPIGPSAL
ncbi:MAG: class I SAM-dependent methyltransferase [Verrucomicrobiota bacterium]